MNRSGVLKTFLIVTISVGFIQCAGLSPDVMPEIDAIIKSMKNCTDPNNYHMLYRDVDIKKTGKNTYTMGATFVTLNEIPGPIKVVHKVDACGTQEKPNCQFFTEMVSEDGCKELEQERGSLYKTFKKVKMEHIRCPLPADSYIIEPYVLKLPDEAKTMVARSELWEVESTMSRGDEILACIKIIIELKPKGSSREKARKGGKKKD